MWGAVPALPAVGGHQSPLEEGVVPSSCSHPGILCPGRLPRLLEHILSQLSSFSSCSRCCDSEQPQAVSRGSGGASGVLHTLVLLGLQTRGWICQTDSEQLGELRDFAWMGLRSQHHISPVQASSELSWAQPPALCPLPLQPQLLSM